MQDIQDTHLSKFSPQYSLFSFIKDKNLQIIHKNYRFDFDGIQTVVDTL